jgi:DNA-binding transcriptional MerR regulator
VKAFFGPKDVAMLIGISYRQIDYWDKTSFIKPAYRRRGKFRLYTFADLIYLKFAKILMEHKYSLHRLRRMIKSLRALLPRASRPIDDLCLLIDGERILAFFGKVIVGGNAAADYIRFDAKSLIDEIRVMFADPSESFEEKTAA